ncbi:hypothetical protein NP233_g32 [Leucocoprinus birnbaumii]|uniref:Fatty acid desaturase domain-containing protein n=1 Tax=Leucocoprinus birnbaumii TaxID=56174 RepID=A0AAD5YX21_9AGAR|nr:hypothetical protein NP233_g32 [Leucocoprinus birnbaumii]
MTYSKCVADGSTVQQDTFEVPSITIKEVREVIPPHCFERSTFISSLYVLRDILAIVLIYRVTIYLDSTLVETMNTTLESFRLCLILRFVLWSIYGFAAGGFGTGLYLIGHECGHQAFSDSKLISDCVGLIVHTALGVPYFSWRASHAQHHAFGGHMTKDLLYHVPPTRSELGLPPLDPYKEDPTECKMTGTARQALFEAFSESPIAAALRVASLLRGVPLYSLRTSWSLRDFSVDTKHGQQRPRRIIWSDSAILVWLAVLALWAYIRGCWEVLTVYGIPYLWLNYQVVLATYLQHTDPLLPRYRGSAYTFSRGALATFDRPIFCNKESFISRIASDVVHGATENHVIHHFFSKIPHYHAWEATSEMRRFLRSRGIETLGAPVSLAEAIRVWKECMFVEDEGDVVFHKNAHGVAHLRLVLSNPSTT